VLDNYKKFDIPIDVQYIDIDYMQDYEDYTYNHKTFKGLPEFIDLLHNHSMKVVPILDAGVAVKPNQSYYSYDSGIQKDVFIKIKNEPFVGSVWPGDAVYPDFFNNQTTPWWHEQLDRFYSEVKFDGLWLDMNEVANFCNGICKDS